VIPADLVRKRKTVCFFLGASPTADVKASVYGSELMAYRLAEELAKDEALEVYVVGIYVLHAYERRGVRYLPSRVLYQLPRFAPPGFKFDVMVVSRYVEYFVDFDARALADRTFVWVHDNHVVGFYQNMPMKDDGRGLVRNLDLAAIDAFVALSPWHARCLADLYGPGVAAKIRVVPNCYDEAAFAGLDTGEEVKVPLSFVWVSCPDRGLADVVRHFPALVERFPGATLHVYRKAMPELERGAHPAITFHGFAPNDVVIAAMARADYWLYPTDFKESSCISALEAQRAGCVCIATRVAALATTLGPDTLFVGPEGGPEGGRWTQVLERIARCEADPEMKARVRASGRAWAMQNSAASVAAQWRAMMTSAAPI
jgi:glycosyltransferase involved in cell wall biosynthesis